MCEGFSITTRAKKRVIEPKLDIVQMPFEAALAELERSCEVQ
jgi:hypothetical protein